MVAAPVGTGTGQAAGRRPMGGVLLQLWYWLSTHMMATDVTADGAPIASATFHMGQQVCAFPPTPLSSSAVPASALLFDLRAQQWTHALWRLLRTGGCKWLWRAYPIQPPHTPLSRSTCRMPPVVVTYWLVLKTDRPTPHRDRTGLDWRIVFGGIRRCASRWLWWSDRHGVSVRQRWPPQAERPRRLSPTGG
jgi:hypothetical protein